LPQSYKDLFNQYQNAETNEWIKASLTNSTKEVAEKIKKTWEKKREEFKKTVSKTAETLSCDKTCVDSCTTLASTIEG